jgi:hypothetical protein
MVDRPQTVNAAWAHGGARTLAAGPPVRPRGPQGRHGADACPSLHPLSFFLPRSSPKRATEPLPCCELRRHRACSPPHLHLPDHVHRTATIPSTSSTPLSSEPSQGKGLLADPAATAMGSTSPELGRSMAEVARALLNLPFLPHSLRLDLVKLIPSSGVAVRPRHRRHPVTERHRPPHSTASMSP